jgi:hypothetical protein
VPLAIPQPESVYRGNYASLPASTLKPPVEGNRTVPVEILWLRDGQTPRYTIHFNARSQQTLAISQICAVHIDNSQCGSSMHVAFPDTQFECIVGANQVGFYPIVTNSLEFWAWIDTTPLAQDKTIIQVLNFLPPPILFSTSIGGASVGTVREVDTAAPIQGGPITDTGTISLAVPLAVNFGGTAGTTGNAALDNLSGASGSASGTLSRSSGGVWSVSAALSTPFPVSSGGTGQVSFNATAILTGNGAAPIVASAATLTSSGGMNIPQTLGVQGTANLHDVTIPTTLNVTGLSTLAGVNSGNQAITGNLTLSGGEVIGNTAPVTANALLINDTATQPAAGATGAGRLTIASETHNAEIELDAYGTTVPALVARRSRGTAAAPTAVQGGDTLLIIQPQGYAATTWGTAPNITIAATEIWTASANGSAMYFATTPAGGTAGVNSLVLTGNSATFSGNVSMAQQVSLIAAAGNDATVLLNTTATSGGHTWFLSDKGGGAPIGALQFYDLTANALRLQIDTAGACSASSAWSVISDASLKTAIDDHPHGLAEILKLRPRRFRYVEDERPGSGLIAQELAEIMPELVSEMIAREGEAPVKTVCETGIIWPLINAVKELSARLAALEGAR